MSERRLRRRIYGCRLRQAYGWSAATNTADLVQGLANALVVGSSTLRCACGPTTRLPTSGELGRGDEPQHERSVATPLEQIGLATHPRDPHQCLSYSITRESVLPCEPDADARIQRQDPQGVCVLGLGPRTGTGPLALAHRLRRHGGVLGLPSGSAQEGALAHGGPGALLSLRHGCYVLDL